MENNKEIYADIKVLEAEGFDFKERIIYLIGDIEEDDVVPTLRQLHFLTSEKRFPDTFKDPIMVVLSSDGGSDEMLTVLYDAMTTCKAPIITLGTGMVCSSATLVLVAGDKRYTTENCMVMTHKGKFAIDGDEDEIAAQTELHAKMSHKYWHLLARHTKKSAKVWRGRSKERGEHWMDADEMLEWGVVDGIIKPTRKLRKVPKMSKKALDSVVHRVEFAEDDLEAEDDDS